MYLFDRLVELDKWETVVTVGGPKHGEVSRCRKFELDRLRLFRQFRTCQEIDYENAAN